jgi:hypothetical protein
MCYLVFYKTTVDDVEFNQHHHGAHNNSFFLCFKNILKKFKFKLFIFILN